MYVCMYVCKQEQLLLLLLLLLRNDPREAPGAILGGQNSGTNNSVRTRGFEITDITVLQEVC